MSVHSAEIDIVRIFLDSASQYPPLTEDQEIEYAQAMEAPDNLRSDALAIDNVAEQARVTLIQSNLKLVASEAMKINGTDQNLLMDDIQVGTFGLFKAVDTYDWRKGFRFSSHSVPIIRGYILSERCKQPALVRIPEKTGKTLFKALREGSELTSGLRLVADCVFPTSLDTTVSAQDGVEELKGNTVADHPRGGEYFRRINVDPDSIVALINSKGSSLTEKQREVIRLKLDLDDELGRERSWREVAQILGVHHQGVEKTFSRAVRNMRQSLAIA